MNLIKPLVISTVLILFLSCEFRVNADHVSEGNKLANQGDYFNASLEYDDALFIDQDNITALKGQVFCSMRSGNLEKALKAVNHYIKLRPDSSALVRGTRTNFLPYPFPSALVRGTRTNFLPICLGSWHTNQPFTLPISLCLGSWHTNQLFTLPISYS